MARQFIAGIPAYFYPWPANEDWAELAALPAGSMVVVNPATGPGTQPDARYVEMLRELIGNGLVLLGYLDSNYGAVGADSLVRQVGRYRSWYGVDGVFLDRTAPDGGSVAHYTELVQRLRDVGVTKVAANPGQPNIDERYADVFDNVVMFEGSYLDYASIRFPCWVRRVASPCLWHLVYNVSTTEEMEDVTSRAVTHNAGVLFVTDGEPPNAWDHLPSYWKNERLLF